MISDNSHAPEDDGSLEGSLVALHLGICGCDFAYVTMWRIAKTPFTNFLARVLKKYFGKIGDQGEWNKFVTKSE